MDGEVESFEINGLSEPNVDVLLNLFKLVRSARQTPPTTSFWSVQTCILTGFFYQLCIFEKVNLLQ